MLQWLQMRPLEAEMSVELELRGTRRLLHCAFEAMDQPTLDGSNVYEISQVVRSSGVNVALSRPVLMSCSASILVSPTFTSSCGGVGWCAMASGS